MTLSLIQVTKYLQNNKKTVQKLHLSSYFNDKNSTVSSMCRHPSDPALCHLHNELVPLSAIYNLKLWKTNYFIHEARLTVIHLVEIWKKKGPVSSLHIYLNSCKQYNMRRCEFFFFSEGMVPIRTSLPV